MKIRAVLVLVFLMLILVVACDVKRIIDENKSITDAAWFYKDKLSFDTNIKDINKTYNVFVNLRISSDYEYSNIFVILYQKDPQKKESSERFEFALADPSGKWLGNGLGDVFDYQLMAKERVRFDHAGVYKFELEQNMRVDTLRYIKSAGIRIEECNSN